MSWNAFNNLLWTSWKVKENVNSSCPFVLPADPLRCAVGTAGEYVAIVSIRHNSVVLGWFFISRRLLCGILCKEINCSNDIWTVITQLIQGVLCLQYEALNWNIMETYMYTSAVVCVSVVVGAGWGGNALKILIYNVPFLIMCQTLSESVLAIETLNCVNDLCL